MVRILDLPEVRARLTALGFEKVGGSSEQTARRIRSDVAKWIKVAKHAGIKPQ
jgi:tripartite-type tricarboxylate transporter receptor subunit TctC